MNESVKTFKNESTTIILYKDNNVVTTKQLAEFYGVEAEKLKYNFNYNKGRYKDGKHYYKLEGEELKEFKDKVGISNLVESNAKILYLWTEEGALYHAKSLNTKKAWEVFEMLVKTYFQVKEIKEKIEAKEDPKIDNEFMDFLTDNFLKGAIKYNRKKNGTTTTKYKTKTIHQKDVEEMLSKLENQIDEVNKTFKEIKKIFSFNNENNEEGDEL